MLSMNTQGLSTTQSAVLSIFSRALGRETHVLNNRPDTALAADV